MTASRTDLEGLTGKGVRVAVVDSGISPIAAAVGELEGGVALYLASDGAIREGVAITDHLGHGTACAGIIRSLAPGVRLFAVRVFDTELATSGAQLVAAIDWAARQKMQVVNLSLGTTDAAMAGNLEAACRRAVEAGVVLVAAESNDGLAAYPAVLPEAIGVRAGRVQSRYGYFWQESGPVECVARGDAQRVRWLGGRQVMVGGSSFAAPRITAVVALLLEAHPEAGPAEVRAHLRATATAILGSRRAVGGPAPDRVRDAGPAHRFRAAVLYPFAKEMHAFLRYPDLTAFAVVGVADPVGRGLVGRDAGEIAGGGRAGVTVTPSLGQVEAACDALVLGHLARLGQLRRRDLLSECLAFALDRGLHVFSFDSLRPERYGAARREAGAAGLRLRWPEVTAEHARGVLAGEPAEGAVDVPVVAVVGTSAAQGKFTLQLALRRELLERGYRVGQLGTEPHSQLFGMDAVFPMGYGSTVEIPVDAYPRYLDRVLRRICWSRRPDLIVAGAQSGTIPYDLRDERTLTLPSLAFLMGIRPDAAILVVNPMDPPAYVRDTVDAVRAIGKAEVVALATSDRPRQVQERLGRAYAAPAAVSAEALRAQVQGLEEGLGLEVTVIGDGADVARLADRLIGRFGGHARSGGEEECLARTV